MEYRDQSTFGKFPTRTSFEKSEAEIDWTKNAEVVRNQIHALSPAPGARSEVMIWKSQRKHQIFPRPGHKQRLALLEPFFLEGNDGGMRVGRAIRILERATIR